MKKEILTQTRRRNQTEENNNLLNYATNQVDAVADIILWSRYNYLSFNPS